MKKLATIAIVFGIMLFLNGCYTVVQYSGDYSYTDNSTTVIIPDPVPPPPPVPPPHHPIHPPYIPPQTPVSPPTKERIETPNRDSGSTQNNNPRNTGGRDSGGRNGNSR